MNNMRESTIILDFL